MRLKLLLLPWKKNVVTAQTMFFFQGRFRISLSGMGFKLADNTKWISQGNYAIADIHRSEVIPTESTDFQNTNSHKNHEIT